MPEQTEIGELQGLYNRKEIEDTKWYECEGAVTAFLDIMNDYSPTQAINKLQGLLSRMKALMEKPFKYKDKKGKWINEIMDYCVLNSEDNKEYNFYQLKEIITKLHITNMQVIRNITEMENEIFGHFAKRLGMEIATVHLDKKKRSPEPFI